MIKVLGLALYGPLAASNRYRLGQYVLGLNKLGIDLEVRHILGDDYLRARFSGGTIPMASVLKMGLKRIADLWHKNNYDIAMLHCELIPLAPGWIEKMMIRKPYIYDFDDAFYLKYKSDRMSLLRPLIGGKFDTIMTGAAAITAGNHTLANYASKFNTNTYYLPTVVDIMRYQPQVFRRDDNFFTVGWIGSPSTAPYLDQLVEPLSIIGQEGQVKLIVIGGKAPKIPNVLVVEFDWNELTELDLINSFDVGVMPLPDSEWARGKCAFKLIQYMACAVPVIASNVGANIDVVNCESGILVSSMGEWLASLRLLRDEPSTRIKMGEAGRARIVQDYSLHHNLPVLADIIRKVACEI